MQLLVRSKEGCRFENVTQSLVYIYADLDKDGIVKRYALFSDELMGYFWNYDNQGLKLARQRFYESLTDVDEIP